MISFKHNRAMFFNSHIHHTDLQALGESSPRYTLGILFFELKNSYDTICA